MPDDSTRRGDGQLSKRAQPRLDFQEHLADLEAQGLLVRVDRPVNLRPVIFVQFARDTLRTEVWRGLHGAATLRPECGKIVIAVSEDIDPEGTDAVFWSLRSPTGRIRLKTCTSRRIAAARRARNTAQPNRSRPC